VQLALSKYNAIYGSFSALPLFLVWSYLNWLTVLFGVTLSYLYQNYDYESELARDRERSDAEKRLIALIFTAMVTKAFADDDKLLTAEDLAQRTNLSGTLAIEVINTLEKRKILVALADSEYANPRYMPALPLNKMTIINVLERYDKHENTSSFAIVNQPCAKKALEIMFNMRQTLANSEAQRPITDMLNE
jgi:membrane protein